MADLSSLPAQWRRSGLSQRAFCEHHDVPLATFAYWRAKELRAERAAQRSSHPGESGASLEEVITERAFTEVIVEGPATSGPAMSGLAAVAPRGTPAIEVTFPDGTHVRIPFPASC